MIGVKGTTLYGLCPGCNAWQVDIQTPLPDMDSIDAIEAAIGEHARTECLPLLRLAAGVGAGATYGQAQAMLA